MGNEQSCNYQPEIYKQLLSTLDPAEYTIHPLVNGRVFQISFGNNSIGISIKCSSLSNIYKTALWCFATNKVIYNFMWMYYDTLQFDNLQEIIKEIDRVRRLVLGIAPDTILLIKNEEIEPPSRFYSEYDHGIVILNRSPE